MGPMNWKIENATSLKIYICFLRTHTIEHISNSCVRLTQFSLYLKNTSPPLQYWRLSSTGFKHCFLSSTRSLLLCFSVLLPRQLWHLHTVMQIMWLGCIAEFMLPNKSQLIKMSLDALQITQPCSSDDTNNVACLLAIVWGERTTRVMRQESLSTSLLLPTICAVVHNHGGTCKLGNGMPTWTGWSGHLWNPLCFLLFPQQH